MRFRTRLHNAWLLYRYAAADARTPAAPRFLPWIALLYLVFPFDIIPDLIPLLGQLDDLGVIILFCTIALQLIPRDVRRDFRRGVIEIEPKR